MNLDQVKLFRDLYTKESTRPDNGRKTTNGEYIRFCLDGGVDFVTSKDLVVYDDNNTLLHCVAKTEEFEASKVFPIKIISSDYAIIQQIETIMSKDNFLELINGDYFGGLLNDEQKKFFVNYVNNIKIQPVVPKSPNLFDNDDDVVSDARPSMSYIAAVNHNGSVVKAYTFKDVESYNAVAASGSLDGAVVMLNLSGVTYTSGLGLYNTQNNPNPPKLILNINNCVFDGTASDDKQIYVANAYKMTVDNCTFRNSGENNYAIDINHCSIKDATFSITNCTFEDPNVKSCIKASARLGSTDHPTDIVGAEEGSIKSVYIHDCIFPEGTVGFTRGTNPKGEDTAANITTGYYALTIEAAKDSPVIYKMPCAYDKGQYVPKLLLKANTGLVSNPETVTSIASNEKTYVFDELNGGLDGYNTAIANNELDGSTVTLNIKNQTFNSGLDIYNAQRIQNPPKLILTVDNCTFDGTISDKNNKKQIYVTNAYKMTINRCTFDNTGENGCAIDINQCSIKDATFTIENCVFKDSTVKSCIKASARLGSTDHSANVTGATEGTIKNLRIRNCTFPENTIGYTHGIGPKGEDTTANTSTGNFTTYITTKEAVTYTIPSAYDKGQYVKECTANANETTIIDGELVNSIANNVKTYEFDDLDGVTNYNTHAKSKELNGAIVTLNINDQTFDSGLQLIDTENYSNPPKLKLYLDNCAFNGTTPGSYKKQVYIANAYDINISNCIFRNTAANDYAIDINNSSVKDGHVNISNCTFEEAKAKSCIKVSTRNGFSDNSSGISGAEGTLDSVVVKNCIFPEGTTGVTQGTTPKGEEFAANISTGLYDLTIINDTDNEVIVNRPFLFDIDTDFAGNKFNTYTSVDPHATKNFYAADIENNMVVANSVEEYNTMYNNNEINGSVVYLNVSGKKFENGLNIVNTQANPNPPKLILRIDDCIFDGTRSDKKQIYLANAYKLLVNNCIFRNSGADDYALDINHCSIKNAKIKVSNCTFEDENVKSSIKASARLGGTDHPTDLNGAIEGIINTVYITKNSFPETATGYTKGTTPKGEDTAANTSTGNYTVIFDNNLTNINYKEPYNYDKDIEVPTIIIPAKSYAAYDIE